MNKNKHKPIHICVFFLFKRFIKVVKLHLEISRDNSKKDLMYYIAKDLYKIKAITGWNHYWVEEEEVKLINSGSLEVARLLLTGWGEKERNNNKKRGDNRIFKNLVWRLGIDILNILWL